MGFKMARTFKFFFLHLLNLKYTKNKMKNQNYPSLKISNTDCQSISALTPLTYNDNCIVSLLRVSLPLLFNPFINPSFISSIPASSTPPSHRPVVVVLCVFFFTVLNSYGFTIHMFVNFKYFIYLIILFI